MARLRDGNPRGTVESRRLRRVDWNVALDDAERELKRTERHAEKLREAIPILRQRVTEQHYKRL